MKFKYVKCTNIGYVHHNGKHLNNYIKSHHLCNIKLYNKAEPLIIPTPNSIIKLYSEGDNIILEEYTHSKQWIITDTTESDMELTEESGIVTAYKEVLPNPDDRVRFF